MQRTYCSIHYPTPRDQRSRACRYTAVCTQGINPFPEPRVTCLLSYIPLLVIIGNSPCFTGFVAC